MPQAQVAHQTRSEHSVSNGHHEFVARCGDVFCRLRGQPATMLLPRGDWQFVLQKPEGAAIIRTRVAPGDADALAAFATGLPERYREDGRRAARELALTYRRVFEGASPLESSERPALRIVGGRLTTSPQCPITGRILWWTPFTASTITRRCLHGTCPIHCEAPGGNAQRGVRSTTITHHRSPSMSARGCGSVTIRRAKVPVAAM